MLGYGHDLAGGGRRPRQERRFRGELPLQPGLRRRVALRVRCELDPAVVLLVLLLAPAPLGQDGMVGLGLGLGLRLGMELGLELGLGVQLSGRLLGGASRGREREGGSGEARGAGRRGGRRDGVLDLSSASAS